MTAAELRHQQAAHCESGVISTLLRHRGLDIGEPMAFGLASAISFAFIPLIKLGGMPLIAYRTAPRRIITCLARVLGLGTRFHRFRRADAGMAALDRELAAGRVVGLQASVFWLPYFPPEMRFHYNAHNLLVYGKEGDEYLISDPVFEEPVRCPASDLKKSRFAKGMLAPRGMMFYLDRVPANPDLAPLVLKSIRKSVKIMTGLPVPFMGLAGVGRLARRIEQLDSHPGGARYARLFLGHIVRMQEEIGTGGAGFRFLYASFLEQAATVTGNSALDEASRAMTAAGDTWREFALRAVKVCKNREAGDYGSVASELRRCADTEARVWDMLRSA